MGCHGAKRCLPRLDSHALRGQAINPLQELLARRASVSAAELMQQLEEGLSQNPEQSGAGAAVHRLLLDYFKWNEWVCNASFAAACKKYPATAAALQELCTAHGLSTIAGLIASVSPKSTTEMDLSLAWGAVEECLLDQLALHSGVMAFDWGPDERHKRQQAALVQSALAGTSAAQMLAAFLTDTSPHVLAQASAWDIAHAGASADTVAIPVQSLGPTSVLPAEWAQTLDQYPAAQQLGAVYRHINGAALLCTNPHDVWSAGLLLLPAEQWEAARQEVLQWLTAVDFQDDPSALPEWVYSAIAFGKIPGDASYWLLPVTGPFAGRVLLSNEDVALESLRYADFDTFIATLRLQPEAIVGNGGYISYPSADGKFSLYPVGYSSGPA